MANPVGSDLTLAYIVTAPTMNMAPIGQNLSLSYTVAAA